MIQPRARERRQMGGMLAPFCSDVRWASSSAPSLCTLPPAGLATFQPGSGATNALMIKRRRTPFGRACLAPCCWNRMRHLMDTRRELGNRLREARLDPGDCYLACNGEAALEGIEPMLRSEADETEVADATIKSASGSVAPSAQGAAINRHPISAPSASRAVSRSASPLLAGSNLFTGRPY